MIDKLFRWVARRGTTGHLSARQWSNRELARFAPLFHGAVVNVSAGADSDKEGRRYRDHFTGAEEYAVSNYGAPSGLENEFMLDLETAELPVELVERFDVVLSHTVLEHVYEVHRAVQNISAMSRDIVVTVVPFLQSFHRDTWYGDFWRFSPVTLTRMFAAHGFETVYVSWNEDPLENLYVFHICSKSPDRWDAIRRQQPEVVHGPGVSRNLLVHGGGGLGRAVIELDHRAMTRRGSR